MDPKSPTSTETPLTPQELVAHNTALAGAPGRLHQWLEAEMRPLTLSAQDPTTLTADGSWPPDRDGIWFVATSGPLRLARWVLEAPADGTRPAAPTDPRALQRFDAGRSGLMGVTTLAAVQDRRWGPRVALLLTPQRDMTVFRIPAAAVDAALDGADQTLGDELSAWLQAMVAAIALRNTPSLAVLTSGQAFMLAGAMRVHSFSAGEQLAGGPDDAAWVVAQGGAVEVVRHIGADTCGVIAELRCPDCPLRKHEESHDAKGRGGVAAPVRGPSYAGQTRDVRYHLHGGAVFGLGLFKGVRWLRGATAIKPTIAWSMRRFDLFKAAARSPGIGRPLRLLQLLESVEHVESRAPCVVSALRRDPVFGAFDEDHLYPLTQGGRKIEWRVGVPGPSPIGDVAGALVPLEGAIVVTSDQRNLDVDLSPTIPAATPASDVFGPFGVVGARALQLGMDETTRWTPRSPVSGVFISASRVQRELGDTQAWTQAAATATGTFGEDIAFRESWLAAAGSVDGNMAHAVGAMLVQAVDKSNPARCAALANLLGQAIQTQFEEPAVLVTLRLAPKAKVVTGLGADPRGRLALDVPNDVSAAFGALTKLLVAYRKSQQDHRGMRRWIIHCGPGLDKVEQMLLMATRHVIFLSSDPALPFPHEPPPGTAYVYALFMDPGWDVGAMGHRVAPPSTVRLRLSMKESWCAPDAPGAKHDLATLDHPVRDRLARLARAATFRRVGLALGGGGAWGYAHIALIDAMVHLGIPIDAISGASFGSVVGGWYSRGYGAMGDTHLGDSFVALRRLHQLLDPTFAARLSRILYGTMLSGGFLQRFIHGELGRIPLQALEIPFFPVATDLVSGSEVALDRGSVAFGIRASGSLPPLYPATRTHRRILVDGGMSFNVPANVLRLEGIRLIVASNIVPPSPASLLRPPYSHGKLGNLMRELSPVYRMASAFIGTQVLYNTVGNVDALQASSYFATSQSFYFSNQFKLGRQIMLDTQTSAAFQDGMRGLQWRWNLLLQGDNELFRLGPPNIQADV